MTNVFFVLDLVLLVAVFVGLLLICCCFGLVVGVRLGQMGY